LRTAVWSSSGEGQCVEISYGNRRPFCTEVPEQECLAVMPDDGPSLAIRERIARLRDAILPANWDGVSHATSK
jgi:hypothetical protein